MSHADSPSKRVSAGSCCSVSITCLCHLEDEVLEIVAVPSEIGGGLFAANNDCTRAVQMLNVGV